MYLCAIRERSCICVFREHVFVCFMYLCDHLFVWSGHVFVCLGSIMYLCV